MMRRTRGVALAAVLALVPAVPVDARKGLDAEQAATAALVRAVWPDHAEAAAVRVAYCESKLRPWARHRNRNGTRDRGVFQLNDGGTMQALGLTAAEALEPEANVRAALRLWRRRGWRPWTCRHAA